MSTRAELYIDFCERVWGNTGDCELSNWTYESSTYLDAVSAEGVPPGCHNVYKHVFVFVRTWRNGKQIHYLRGIYRNRKGAGLHWSTMTGEALRCKVYRNFSIAEYPLPASFGVVS